MKFSDLENVPIYTILKDTIGGKRYFYGFTPDKKRITTSHVPLDQNDCSVWSECEISSWTIIKEPKRIYEHFCRTGEGGICRCTTYKLEKYKVCNPDGFIGTKEIVFE